MAHYLVRARLDPDDRDLLAAELRDRAFIDLQPFGRALTQGLENARRGEDGTVLWEEEDHCSPPLAQEREAVLDRYFDALEVERVEKGEGWRRIRHLPRVFPNP